MRGSGVLGIYIDYSMEKKKIYNEPMLKVSDLRIEACMLEASIEVGDPGAGGGAGAKGGASWDDEEEDDNSFGF